MWKRLVAADFCAPPLLETERVLLRPLTIHDVDRDYDAVMSSVDHLARTSERGWPRGLTLEQNLIDLAWHQKNHQLGVAFTYTVVPLDEHRCLGCVYLEPTDRAGFDAE